MATTLDFTAVETSAALSGFSNDGNYSKEGPGVPAPPQVIPRVRHMSGEGRVLKEDLLS